MSVVTYKCKNCGGELLFNPDTQKFSCKYCMSSFTKSEIIEPEKEEKQDDQFDDNGEIKDTAVYSCPNCGAQVVTDSTTAATYCYYCHNPVVLMGRLDGKFLPDRIIPFKINRDSAIEKFLGWTKNKKFVPKDFYSEKQIEKLTGVYFPYWIVDCDTTSQMSAKANRVRTWTTGNTRYTETSTYMVDREGEIHLEDVIKTALTKANKKLVETVQPFDEKDFEKFSTVYLSGFQAEKRDVERASLQQEVDSDIKGFCDNLLRDTISGYTSVTPVNSNTNIKNIAWEYSLLPVWTMTYKYKNKTYYYAMNGQTGKVCGKLPVNMKKLIAVASGVSAVLMAIISLGGYLI